MVFGSVAGVMLVASLASVVLTGHLTLVSPFSFGALLAVALAFVLKNLLTARERGEILSRQAAQLKTVAGRLEASLKNAATINARLNQSEARYKGLVDAQGDAIFRRDGSSRLTYGNDAFFKLTRPVVAAIGSHAVGAGMTFAAICDIRVAAENVIFSMRRVLASPPA